ncbi:MAG: TatD family hydrolase, partial [Chloroflexi bacterium]|nr:TatD family hydrolase [Chloroflexota bacterium]
GGYITYPSSKELAEVVKELPLDRLLTETDCPFLPPQGKRGQRNEPSYVTTVVAEIARIKGISVAEVDRATSANAIRLFKLA